MNLYIMTINCLILTTRSTDGRTQLWAKRTKIYINIAAIIYSSTWRNPNREG